MSSATERRGGAEREGLRGALRGVERPRLRLPEPLPPRGLCFSAFRGGRSPRLEVPEVCGEAVRVPFPLDPVLRPDSLIPGTSRLHVKGDVCSGDWPLDLCAVETELRASFSGGKPTLRAGSGSGSGSGVRVVLGIIQTWAYYV